MMLTAMQEVLILLLNRCVHGAEGIQKLLTENVGLRPNSLSQIQYGINSEEADKDLWVW